MSLLTGFWAVKASNLRLAQCSARRATSAACVHPQCASGAHYVGVHQENLRLLASNGSRVRRGASIATSGGVALLQGPSACGIAMHEEDSNAGTSVIAPPMH